MPRRWKGSLNGERFLGNLDKLEVHDLDRETPSCRIDEIIAGDREMPFRLAVEARSRGYAACRHCITTEAGGQPGPKS
jgi:hypothetical protein